MAKKKSRGKKYDELLTPLDTVSPSGANAGEWDASTGDARPENAPTLDPSDPLGIALGVDKVAPGGRVSKGKRSDVEG